VTKSTIKPKKKEKVSFNWQVWLDEGVGTSWKMLFVSETSENCVVSADQSLTRLVGIDVGGKVIPTIDINLDSLHKIAARLSLRKCRTMRKIVLCDALVNLRERREYVNDNEPITDDGNYLHFNYARYVNVVFGDNLAPQFACLGQLLDKDDLDDGVTIDEKLYLDFLKEYNDESNEAYNKAAHELHGLGHPSMFDQYPSEKWEAAQKIYYSVPQLFVFFDVQTVPHFFVFFYTKF
jgi:hypothetical protein